MPCNGCGDCCNPVVLGAGYRERLLSWDFDWEPTHDDYECALWAAALIPREGEADGVFTCPSHDPQRGCLRYETRPTICRGFPWYDGFIDKALPLVSPRCGYWHESSVSIGALAGGASL